MKISQRITFIFATLLMVCTFMLFKSMHSQKEAFEKGKTNILISAGYNGTISAGKIWRENGHFYVNGHTITDTNITSAINNLIMEDEKYDLFHVFLIVIIVLLILVYRFLYKEIQRNTKKYKKINEKHIIETIAIQDARKKSVPYDFEKDKTYPLK